MPESSSSIGVQRDLSVRLGNTLRPMMLTLRLKTGVLIGGTVRAEVFLAEASTTPVSIPTFAITQMETLTTGEPRYRLSLDKDRVAQLAQLSVTSAGTASSRLSTGVRTLWWTCSYEDDAGNRYPLYYGRLLIYLGAAGG